MSEIYFGEYCRTKKGYIAKITEIDNYIWFNEKINKESGTAVYELSKLEFENLVTKHSFNIIDLIEEGDYVNGKKVSSVDTYDKTNVIEWEDGDVYTTEIANDKFIKSIVTKERFKESEYIINE